MRLCLPITLFAILLSGTGSSLAGGSAENATLIIDPSNQESMYIGNYYKNARNIPDANVIYMRSTATNYSEWSSTVQAAFEGVLWQRGIVDHADYAIVAPLNAFYIPSGYSSGNIGTCGTKRFSLSGAYSMIPTSDLYQLTADGSGGLNEFSPRQLPDPNPAYPALAFHGRQRYLHGVPSNDAAAASYYIGAMLGYTGPNGNTVTELLSMIDRSVAVDGTRPAGTFYFMNNVVEPLRNVRACSGGGNCPNGPTYYNDTATQINLIGGSAQVLNGALPPNGTTGVMGIMSGFPTADIPGANLDLVPGAFADHLTSHAATFDTSAQTKASEWIRAGASGSAGAVEEPCNDKWKFPLPDFHWWYYQGSTLGEAYFRSMMKTPRQSELYGDPLTRPFAYIPNVTVTTPPVGVRSGTISITPSATTAKPSATIASYDLLVDGVKMSSAPFGQSLSFDTRLVGDGRHDVRVLAYDDTSVQDVGRWIGTVDTSNFGHSATLSVSPSTANRAQLFTFLYSASSAGLREVRLMQNGRVLVAATAATGTLSVYGQNLGAGNSKVKLEALYTDNRVANSVPVNVSVTAAGTPINVTPVAYSYTKTISTLTAHVVELPASYDSLPSGATYTLLNTPTQATVVQAGLTGPYRIIRPMSGATGSEQLQFRVTTAAGNSNIATVTLEYKTAVSILTGPSVAVSTPSAAAVATTATQQGGTAKVGYVTHAALWNGTEASWIDLNPAGAAFSAVTGITDREQAGHATFLGRPHAGIWRGSAQSWIDLHPSGAEISYAFGINRHPDLGGSTSEQVGQVSRPIDLETRATLWHGTAASRVDLHPAGAESSAAYAADELWQAGYAVFDGVRHAGMWWGTASSWVDLHPSGATQSAIWGTTDGQFVGEAAFGGDTHAMVWAGTGTIDLHPAGATRSVAYATDGNWRLVGEATFGGVTRAGMWTWTGLAFTWVDLSALLPPQYAGLSSTARAIYADENGTHVVGSAQDSNGVDVVIWTVP